MNTQTYGTSWNEDGLRNHFAKTFQMMGLGLLTTFLTASLLYATNISWYLFATVPMISLIMLLVQIGVVVSFTKNIRAMSTGKAKRMFFVYAVITGVTFSVLGYAYSARAICIAFAISAVYFGLLAFIGSSTKLPVYKFGTLLSVSLITLIVFEVVAMFSGVFSQMEMVFCSIGLVLFTGITVYDVQKMKMMYLQHEYDPEMTHSLSIYSAFELYLDFINIFIYILRLTGNSRD